MTPCSCHEPSLQIPPDILGVISGWLNPLLFIQVMSSVLYLGDCGGPTLIINQTSSSDTLDERAWAVHPVDGRLVVFKGDLLHGVLPGVLPPFLVQM